MTGLQKDNRGSGGRRRGWLAKGCFAIVLCQLTVPLYAHRLIALARVEGDDVVVEAFFADDSPARGAEVTVREKTPAPAASSGAGAAPGQDGARVIASGKTDEQGLFRFRFRPRRLADLTVAVKDPYGHAARFEIPAARIAPFLEREDGKESEKAEIEDRARAEENDILGDSSAQGLAGRFPTWLLALAGIGAVALLALLAFRLARWRRQRGCDAS
jgi:hypothetical protein